MTEMATTARTRPSRNVIWAGAAALVLVIAVALGWRSNLVPEPVMEMLSYVTSSFLLDGALTAIEIAALAMLGGIVLGLLLALMRLSGLKLLRDSGFDERLRFAVRGAVVLPLHAVGDSNQNMRAI